MADPPEIWLIRHGETAWSRTGRHTGRTDLPLTAVGEQEAATLRQRLGGRRFALVLSSPLVRAWQTCRIAGYGEEAERADDLMEWDYGDYEGRTAAEIRAQVTGWLLWTDGVPNGETAEQVGVRARRIIDRVDLASGDVALFAHGHLLRILAACWIGLSPREGRLLALDTASIGILGHESGGRVVCEWNVAREPQAGAGRRERSPEATGRWGRP
jgi:probable phosphoglycerate mutase